MSQATDVLRHEHDAILMALKILDQISMEARLGNEKPADSLRFLGFLREFADTCHHGKEEGLLFPAMIEAGTPASDGPVSVLRSEHEHGRALVAAMAEAVESPMSPERFSNVATDYAHHMRTHIAKENDEIFPMADRLVAPDVLDGLVSAFERHEEQVMGTGRHEDLHDNAEGIEGSVSGFLTVGEIPIPGDRQKAFRLGPLRAGIGFHVGGLSAAWRWSAGRASEVARLISRRPRQSRRTHFRCLRTGARRIPHFGA